jgi:hypothetical protein
VRLRPPPPAGISPEQFLACVGAAHQQRQRQATWGPAAPHPAVAAAPAAAPGPPEPVPRPPVPTSPADGGFAPPG